MSCAAFKLRFGIIGTNFISDWLLEGAAEDSRFEVAAIYSRSQDTANAFAVKHNIPYTFVSLDAMASSPLIDAVYIASPTALHSEQAILFMEHGKHVLCEKPSASNIRELGRMIEAAKKYGVVFMEAMKSTLMPGFGAILQHLPEIGTVRRYFASYCRYSSRYDKLKAGEVMNAFKPELSNGATMDLGIYTIYPLVVLWGRPFRISATGILLSTGVDGQGAVNLEYGQGKNATILYSKIADSSLPSEIQGEDGTIVIDKIQSPDRILLKHRNGMSQDISIVGRKNEYYYEVKEFIDLVQSGSRESSVNSHMNSFIALEVIDEIRRQLGVIYPADKN